MNEHAVPMALALDLGRFRALDTEHPSTEADDLPGPETAVPARSISPLAEWNYVSPAPPPLTYKSFYRATPVDAQPPAAARASTTQKVLASPISAAASTSTPELSSETHFESVMQSVEELRTADERSAHIEERQAEHEREMDLGLSPYTQRSTRGWASSPAE
ncbi:hypothetical protein B0H14DRAFT_3166415 [Mycena olivaceomarginata]|nr:hypothetical protein B0H14DRAFT_3166415 [Mycena olivaceomarginata]